MARVVITATADADVTGIVAYLVQNAGHQVAHRYFGAFDAVYDRLADFPASGSPRPALGRNARIALVHPFVLIYDYVDDTATVLRVLHGRRNIAREILKR
jgi:toxin ParE1/3/4